MGFEAGDLPHPGKHTVKTYPLTSGSITKGRFVKVESGNTVEMDDTDITRVGSAVALESADFANGDTSIQVVSPNSHVVVVMGGVVPPDSHVILDSSGRAVVAGPTHLELDKVVGRYLSKPGDTISGDSELNGLGIVVLGMA